MTAFDGGQSDSEVRGNRELDIALGLQRNREVADREDPHGGLSDLEDGWRDGESVPWDDSWLERGRVEEEVVGGRDHVGDALAIIHTDDEAGPLLLVDGVLEALTDDGELASLDLVRLHVLVRDHQVAIDQAGLRRGDVHVIRRALVPGLLVVHHVEFALHVVPGGQVDTDQATGVRRSRVDGREREGDRVRWVAVSQDIRGGGHREVFLGSVEREEVRLIHRSRRLGVARAVAAAVRADSQRRDCDGGVRVQKVRNLHPDIGKLNGLDRQEGDQ